MIRLVPKFNMTVVERQIKAGQEAQKNAIRAMLYRVGENYMELAQANATFMNHTFNLRSSIGFAVIEDGAIVSEVFKVISTGSDGAEAGRIVVSQVVSSMDMKEGFGLIVVAGESYAAAVEAKGRDVISGSGNFIEDMLKAALG